MKIFKIKFQYSKTICKIFVVCFLQQTILKAQLPWPSESWDNAINLTQIMNSLGLNDLSGLHWNPDLNRLYVIHGSGGLRVLELNKTNNAFTQIANLSMLGGPEDVTQVNFADNEIYTIDENNYEIRKFTHTANFSNLIFAKSWSLLVPPSPMLNTGNTGPEGITFIPDKFLIAAGFISQSTGQLYTSKKGMGGLMFVAHQDGGYIWVYDINPNVSDDFSYVGKYKTNRDESCDLEFDRSTGLLYILHNTGSNYLEITDLKTIALTGNERKFSVAKEYTIANPSGSINIEGFAISSKCSDVNNVSVWLCRDVEASSPIEEQTDCIRWYQPFTADGNCEVNSILKADNGNDIQIKTYPNPGDQELTISLFDNWFNNATVKIYNSKSQIVYEKEHFSGEKIKLEVSFFENGLYIVEVKHGNQISTRKWLKE